jgi:hypothetical protein
VAQLALAPLLLMLMRMVIVRQFLGET